MGFGRAGASATISTGADVGFGMAGAQPDCAGVMPESGDASKSEAVGISSSDTTWTLTDLSTHSCPEGTGIVGPPLHNGRAAPALCQERSFSQTFTAKTSSEAQAPCQAPLQPVSQSSVPPPSSSSRFMLRNRDAFFCAPAPLAEGAAKKNLFGGMFSRSASSASAMNRDKDKDKDSNGPQARKLKQVGDAFGRSASSAQTQGNDDFRRSASSVAQPRHSQEEGTGDGFSRTRSSQAQQPLALLSAGARRSSLQVNTRV